MTMNIPKNHLFIDESGTPALSTEKDGTTKFFVIVAVSILDKDLYAARNALTLINDEFFSGSPAESKKIKNDHERRSKILKRLFAVEGFGFHALIVEKEKLSRVGGFRFGGSFYKFFNRNLYESIINKSLDLDISADKYRDSQFMEELQDYLSKKFHENMLFNIMEVPTIKFLGCEDEVLMSIPDIIAGTILKIKEGPQDASYTEEWKRILDGKKIKIQPWPFSGEYSFSEIAFVNTGQYDDMIRTFSLSKVQEFINLNSNAHEETVKIQMDVLEFLVYKQVFQEDKDYIYSDKIVAHLQQLGHDIEGDDLRRTIISGLRDESILISSTTKGYKIALCEKDIHDFFSYMRTYVIPMLKRIRIADETLKSLTADNLKILESFPLLKKATSIDWDI